MACPQPGINLPNNWTEDPDEMAYTRTFVSDGNFSAIHQKNNRARPAESLTAGDLFMVEEKRYANHLLVAKEIKEVGFFHKSPAISDFSASEVYM